MLATLTDTFRGRIRPDRSLFLSSLRRGEVIGANGEPSVEQPDLQLPHTATLTPEQEHWLAMQGKAQVLACRTGSCGE